LHVTYFYYAEWYFVFACMIENSFEALNRINVVPSCFGLRRQEIVAALGPSLGDRRIKIGYGILCKALVRNNEECQQRGCSFIAHR
jgi:hypothetical protein